MIGGISPRLGLNAFQKRDMIQTQSGVQSDAQTSRLHIRIGHDVKAQASDALAAMGLSVSDAVRILLKRVIQDQAFPLELKVSNPQTRAAIEEARAMMAAGQMRFATAQDLFDDLEKTSQC